MATIGPKNQIAAPRHARAQERPGDKALAPRAKRDAIARMVAEYHLSERRACRLVGLSRDSYRHPPEVDAATRDLTGRIGMPMDKHWSTSSIWHFKPNARVSRSWLWTRL